MRSIRRTWNARAPTCWIPSGPWAGCSIPRALSTMSRVSPGRALLPRWAISPMRRTPLSRRPPSRRIRTKLSPRPAAKRRVPPQPDKNRTPPFAGFSPDEGGVFVWERRGRRIFRTPRQKACREDGICSGAGRLPGGLPGSGRDSPLYGQYRPKTNTPAAQVMPCGGGVFMYGNRTDQTSS